MGTDMVMRGKRFNACCDVCGVDIEMHQAGPAYFAQMQDVYEWRVPLDRTEVESHLLMHSVCTCEYDKDRGRISTDLACPAHKP